MEIVLFWFKLSLSLFIRVKSALPQKTAWRQTGDKPLSDPMMIQPTNMYMSPGLNELIIFFFKVTYVLCSDKAVYKGPRWLYCITFNLHMTWYFAYIFCEDDIDGLVQDCSNSSALALELLQSCAKPWSSHVVSYFGWIIKEIDYLKKLISICLGASTRLLSSVLQKV